MPRNVASQQVQRRNRPTLTSHIRDNMVKTPENQRLEGLDERIDEVLSFEIRGDEKSEEIEMNRDVKKAIEIQDITQDLVIKPIENEPIKEE